jgi:acyl dehydratase
MGIDPNSVGTAAGPTCRAWTEPDTLLYALGVGAGTDELSFTTENSHDLAQQVLPTYGVVVGTDISVLRNAGEFDWGRLLHGSQSLVIHRPLPAAGQLNVRSEIATIQDKGQGKNAIITVLCRGYDTDGLLVVESSPTFVVRGAGGFGGEPGPRAERPHVPDREPDIEVRYVTRNDQALIYRLSGDRNPLHSDPWFATERAGYPRPILHGLCTFGFGGRALLHEICESDPTRFSSMTVRLAAPVFPGETLCTQAWEVDSGRYVFRILASSTNGSGGRIVLDDGVFATS